MSYYKYDKKTLEEIKNINELISKKQQKIFDILLKISQSFSNEQFTKQKRDEMFNEVDILKQEIKDCNEKLKEIKTNVENNFLEKQDIILKNKEINKQEVVLEKQEKKNLEFVDTVEKLENTLKETQENNVDIKITNGEDDSVSKRKKARTQLIVVEDDDSISGKIKDFFSKLRRIIKK